MLSLLIGVMFYLFHYLLRWRTSIGLFKRGIFSCRMTLNIPVNNTVFTENNDVCRLICLGTRRHFLLFRTVHLLLWKPGYKTGHTGLVPWTQTARRLSTAFITRFYDNQDNDRGNGNVIKNNEFAFFPTLSRLCSLAKYVRSRRISLVLDS